MKAEDFTNTISALEIKRQQIEKIRIQAEILTELCEEAITLGIPGIEIALAMRSQLRLIP